LLLPVSLLAPYIPRGRIFVVRSLYFRIFSTFFLIIFLPLEIAVSIIIIIIIIRIIIIVIIIIIIIIIIILELTTYERWRHGKRNKTGFVFFFFFLYLPLTLVTEIKPECGKKVDLCEWDSEPLCYIAKRTKNKLFTFFFASATFTSGRNMRPIGPFFKGSKTRKSNGDRAGL
jgi:hypothetical protein